MIRFLAAIIISRIVFIIEESYTSLSSSPSIIALFYYAFVEFIIDLDYLFYKYIKVLNISSRSYKLIFNIIF